MKIKSKRCYTTPAGKLWLADCLDVMTNHMERESVDCVFADLPYGTTRNKWDSLVDLEDLWARLHWVCKPNAAMIFTAAQPFTASLIMSNPADFKVEWIWQKERGTGYLNAKKQPLRNHESVLVFYRKPPVYRPQMLQGFAPYKMKASQQSSNYGHRGAVVSESNGERYPVTCPLQFPRDRMPRGTGHPTQKPLRLVKYFLRTYSRKGQLVFDPTFGSATTAVAAAQLGRRFVGCETNPDYFFRAIERIEGAVK